MIMLLYENAGNTGSLLLYETMPFDMESIMSKKEFSIEFITMYYVSVAFLLL
jgi:hypothetical protein